MAPDCHLDSFFLFLFATGVLNYYSSKNCLHSNYLSWEIKQHDSWLASVNSSVSHCFATTMDCSPPGFSVHGIFQAGILEWVAITFSRVSSQPRNLLYHRQILYHLSHQGRECKAFLVCSLGHYFLPIPEQINKV